MLITDRRGIQYLTITLHHTWSGTACLSSSQQSHLASVVQCSKSKVQVYSDLDLIFAECVHVPAPLEIAVSAHGTMIPKSLAPYAQS